MISYWIMSKSYKVAPEGPFVPDCPGHLCLYLMVGAPHTGTSLCNSLTAWNISLPLVYLENFYCPVRLRCHTLILPLPLYSLP
jgi:hypothetical protein